MLAAYLSPLAPAVILLLSAFVLSIVPQLPPRWRSHPWLQQFGAPGLIGVALLSLLFIRLTPGSAALGQGVELLSGWNFSTPESVAALTVRADAISLPFLIILLLFLLSVTLLYSATFRPDYNRSKWERISGWLAISAGAGWLFVAANGLTIVYATLFFDLVIALYWWGRGQNRLGVARLFLAFFTAAALILATLISADGANMAAFLLGVALWLRLGVYPLVEITEQTIWSGDERLTYYGLSLMVGFYLMVRVVSNPLPPSIQWLIALTLLWVGILAWSSAGQFADSEGTVLITDYGGQHRFLLIFWLVVSQTLLGLIAAPLPINSAVAMITGLLLGLVALWATPALGPPRFSERAWSWPYLPAVSATLTIMGVPLFLGWSAKTASYANILRIETYAIVILIVMAEALALTSLARYWSLLWRGREAGARRAVVGIVAMVPFLTPILGPFVLANLGGTMPSAPAIPRPNVLMMMGVVLLAAFGLNYYRHDLLSRLSPYLFIVGDPLHRVLHALERFLEQTGKLLLRLQVMLEGQHYLSWAIFAALIGAIIIVLS